MRSLSSHSFLPLSVSVRRVLFAYLSPHFPLSWKTKEGTRKGVTRRRRSRNVHTVQTEPAVSEKKNVLHGHLKKTDGRETNVAQYISDDETLFNFERYSFQGWLAPPEVVGNGICLAGFFSTPFANRTLSYPSEANGNRVTEEAPC